MARKIVSACSGTVAKFENKMSATRRILRVCVCVHCVCLNVCAYAGQSTANQRGGVLISKQSSV